MLNMSMCIIILAHKLCIMYMHIFTNLFIGYGKNRVCHRRLVHAIEMGQQSMCCQIDAAFLLVLVIHFVLGILKKPSSSTKIPSDCLSMKIEYEIMLPRHRCQ